MAAICFLQAIVELRDEVVGQQRDVLAPLAQRRDVDRHDVQPVEEVLAERPGAHLGQQVAVGRRDQADVDLDGLDAAHALELRLLQDAQQLHLHLDRDLADLVEEQRAAVRQLEAPRLGADGAGEGALVVAEQLRLHERLGDGGAVDLDERPRVPRGVLVQRARDQLLAGPRLAA